MATRNLRIWALLQAFFHARVGEGCGTGDITLAGSSYVAADMGLYEYQSQYSSRPAYRKSGEKWLYYVSSQWRVGSSLGGASSVLINANDPATSPESVAQWSAWAPGWVIDNSLTATCVNCATYSCPAGYAIKNPSSTTLSQAICCQAWGCTTSSGTGCASCVSQANRNSATDCKTCNSGYYKSGTNCQANISESNPRRLTTYGLLTSGHCPVDRQVIKVDCLAAAKSVGADSGKTSLDGVNDAGLLGRPAGCTLHAWGNVEWWGDFNNAACGNLNYDCVCKEAYGCTTGSGIGCATCVTQASRTSVSDCATCNPGYTLSGTTCQATTTTTTIVTTTTAFFTSTTAVVASTTVVATTTTTTPKEEKLEGSVRLDVVNATEFVNEPNVTTLFRYAIAEWFEVNVSWVQDVKVALRTDRHLVARPATAGALRDFLSSLTWRYGRHLLSGPAEAVDVTWSIEIPPGTNTVMVNVLVDNYNSKTVSEITTTINSLISAGVLGEPYDLNVTWNYAWVPEPEEVEIEQPPKEDSGLVVVIVCICAALSVIVLLMLGVVVATKRRKVNGGSRKKKKKGTFDQIAGPLRNATHDELLEPPSEISSEKGRDVEKLMEAISECQEQPAKVFITYAAGSREDDASGFGPATFYVAGLVKFLYDNGIPCNCDLMMGEDFDYKTRRQLFNAQISGRFSSCELLIVILTDSLFLCKDSLRDIYSAHEHKVNIFPLRFEHPIPNERNPWPQIERHEIEYMLMTSTVERGFCQLNSIPSPPYTVLNHPAILKDMLVDLKEMLGYAEEPRKSVFQVFRKSTRVSTKHIDPRPSKLGSNSSDHLMSSESTIPENTPLRDGIDLEDVNLCRSSTALSSITPSMTSKQSDVRKEKKEKKDKTSSKSPRSRSRPLSSPAPMAATKSARTFSTTSKSSLDSLKMKSSASVKSSASSATKDTSSRRKRDMQSEPSSGGRVKHTSAPATMGRSKTEKTASSSSLGPVKSEKREKRETPRSGVRSRSDNNLTEEEDLDRRKREAATKIQSIERGWHARKEYKAEKKQKSSDAVGNLKTKSESRLQV